MSEQRRPFAHERKHEHDETIAAFDRERDEVHELNRRYREMIMNSRRNDRPAKDDHDEKAR